MKRKKKPKRYPSEIAKELQETRYHQRVVQPRKGRKAYNRKRDKQHEQDHP